MRAAISLILRSLNCVIPPPHIGREQALSTMATSRRCKFATTSMAHRVLLRDAYAPPHEEPSPPPIVDEDEGADSSGSEGVPTGRTTTAEHPLEAYEGGRADAFCDAMGGVVGHPATLRSPPQVHPMTAAAAAAEAAAAAAAAAQTKRAAAAAARAQREAAAAARAPRRKRVAPAAKPAAAAAGTPRPKPGPKPKAKAAGRLPAQKRAAEHTPGPRKVQRPHDEESSSDDSAEESS